MRKTKTIITSSLFISALVATTGTNAMFTNNAGLMTPPAIPTITSITHKGVVNNNIKFVLDRKADLKVNIMDKMNFMKSSRAEMKKNIAKFRDENENTIKSTFKSLSKNIRNELKNSRKEYREEAKNIIEQLRDKSVSFEHKIQLKKNLDTLRAKKYADLKSKLQSNSGALNLLTNREAVFEINKDLRNQMSEKRIAFREHRGDIIAKYKTMLIKRIGDKIDKIPTNKLSKLGTKIDELQSKYEKNTRMNKEKKNKILSMIEGLRDVINEKLNIVNVDVDDAMNVVDEVLK